MTKDEMLARMSMSEYVHWQAIYNVEPFPEERADIRAAEQLRMTLIAAGAKQLPKISELLPDYWGEHQTPQQTPEQIKSNMQLVKAANKKKRKK
jgi:hypothetical protein